MTYVDAGPAGFDMTHALGYEKKEDLGGTRAHFYGRSMQNKTKSQEEGRPIFERRDYVRLLRPGDQKTRIDRAVNEKDQRLWPVARAA